MYQLKSSKTLYRVTAIRIETGLSVRETANENWIDQLKVEKKGREKQKGK